MSYTTKDIQLINKTTTEFYNAVADSFSETRQQHWEGWEKALPYFENCNRVLDLGCGNRRFTKFLNENGISCKVENIDNFTWDEEVKQVDIIEELLNDNLNLDSYDVAVCFGVMHHLPGADMRLRLLKELTKSKIAIVSFWQFLRDERIFKKAKETTEVAKSRLGIKNLEENDYFLSWKDRSDVFRFCHNFTDSEIDKFKSSFNTIEDYTADRCNRYLIFNK